MKTLEEALAELEEANSKIAALENDVSTWKTHSRNHENAKKALERELPEKVAAAKAEAKAESEKELKTFRTREIATKYKIPEALSSRISGSTPEELEADAKAFAIGAGFYKEDAAGDTTQGGTTFQPVSEQGTGAAPQSVVPETGAKTVEEFLTAAKSLS